MKILSIQTENFRLHANTSITFQPQGVTGIIGTNETGKSTVLEALEWAFFGGRVIRGTVDSLRWYRAAPRKVATVYVTFEVGGTEYMLKRTENGAKLTDAAGKVIADGTAPVNKKTPKLIGMSYEEFAASYMVKQKDVSRIANMLPTERQGFIRQIMGVGKIDAALSACRKKKSDLSKELDGLSQGLGEREPLEKALSEAQTSLEEAAYHEDRAKHDHETASGIFVAASHDFREVEAEKERHDSLTRTRDILISKIETKKAHIESIETQLREAGDAEPRVKAAEDSLVALPSLREELRELELANVALINRANLEGDLRIAEQQIAEYEEGQSLEEVTKALDEAFSRYSEMESIRLDLRSQRKTAIEILSEEKARNQKRADRLVQLGKDGFCPTCDRILGEDYESVVEKYQSMVDLAEATIEEYTGHVEDYSKPGEEEATAHSKMQELRKEKDRISNLHSATISARKVKAAAEERLSAMGEHHYDEARYKIVKEEVNELVAMDTSPDLKKDRILVGSIPKLEGDLLTEVNLLGEDRQELEGIGESLKKLAFDGSEYENLKAAVEAARQKKEKASVALATRTEEVKGYDREVKHRFSALQEYDKRASRLEEIKDDHLTHERAAARLGDFRVAIAATIRPEMEELMSGFIHLLTDGRHEAVELTEDFSAILQESGMAVEVVSGGTEDIAALAMRLAISQMIAERAGHPLSLLILDEPFGSLDETRRGNVLTLIRKLGNVFRQVFVISHVAETRDAVDHAIELEFDEAAGMTRVLA